MTEERWRLLERGGMMILLAFLLLTVARGDWLPRYWYEQIIVEHEQQLATCEASRGALEATLRAYTAREDGR